MAEPTVDYAAVFRALPGAVVLVTPQLIIADANAEFLLLRGLPREQLVGNFLPEDRPEKQLCRVIPAQGSGVTAPGGGHR